MTISRQTISNGHVDAREDILMGGEAEADQADDKPHPRGYSGL